MAYSGHIFNYSLTFIARSGIDASDHTSFLKKYSIFFQKKCYHGRYCFREPPFASYALNSTPIVSVFERRRLLVSLAKSIFKLCIK